MPVTVSNEATVAVLRETVRTVCGLPFGVTSRLGLALGHAALALRGNDLRDGRYERA